jgi:Domain of unknown function (DUF6285)
MYDHPTAAELIAAARLQIERNILPTLAEPRLRFQTLVAANVLAIVERELAGGEAHLAAAWQRMAELLGDGASRSPAGAELLAAVAAQNLALCNAIRAGAFDAGPQREALLAHLHRTAEAELAVANPRYLERVTREDRR